MPRELSDATQTYLLRVLGPFNDEIILSPEAIACIRSAVDQWRKKTSNEGRPLTVDDLAVIIEPCLCPPCSVTQAVMAYMEAVEHYKWVPRLMRRNPKGGDN